jgi:LuxR family transcriptional regulator, quorum-sensing system regulator BjaR1
MKGTMYQQMVTDCIHDLGTLRRFDGVVARLKTVLTQFGCDNFLFTGLPARGQSLDTLILADAWHPEHLRIYLSRKLVHMCPVVRHCRRTLLPFELSMAPYDPASEPAAAAAMALLADFGLSRGLAIPVPAQGIPQAVGLSGEHMDLSEGAKQALHLLALYGMERLRELAEPHDDGAPGLSAREREVLTWVAYGKSADQVAQILGITTRTVNEHTSTARAKLNAANRAHAVALALERRLIQL